jgi:general stress protein 26
MLWMTQATEGKKVKQLKRRQQIHVLSAQKESWRKDSTSALCQQSAVETKHCLS